MSLIFRLLIIFPVIVLLIRCAHPIAPSGGIKDETPPGPVAASPANGSVNFSGDEFTITFDEFFKLKQPGKEVFISPPMRMFPELRIRHKTLHLRFTEPLRENTTYTVNFGKAIVDITEGNSATNFEYVFSTGPQIDSLSLFGTVVNAFDLVPVKDILVMLYIDDNDTVPFDSLPYLVPPLSATRTGEDGTFRINNLRLLEYKLFALEDLNNNYIFDLPNERIAFLDTLAVPEYQPPEVYVDEEEPGNDTIGEFILAAPFQPRNDYLLYLFTEHDSTQKLIDKKLTGGEVILLTFRQPAEDLDLELLSPAGFAGDWNRKEYSGKGDTVLVWLHSLPSDTLEIALREKHLPEDTLRYIIRKNPDARGLKKKDEQEYLTAKTNTPANILELNRPLKITFSRPLINDTVRDVRFIAGTDTSYISFPVILPLGRFALLEPPFQQKTKYEMLIPPGALTDIQGNTNDTIQFKFTTRSLENYGTLYIDFRTGVPGGNYLVTILNSREEAVETKFVEGSSRLIFSYLLPGTYHLKAVSDINRNGTWDPGKYLENRQPESVIYYPAEITVRSNWELTEEWVVE